jgi:hypothetical protein
MSAEFGSFVDGQGTCLLLAPSGAHVRIVEVCNKITQTVIGKAVMPHSYAGSWVSQIPQTFRVMNARYTKRLEHNLLEIMFGHLPRGALEAEFPPENHVRSASSKLQAAERAFDQS